MPSENFSRQISTPAGADQCWEILTDVPRLVGWVSILDDVHQVARLERYTAVLMDRLGPFRLRADLDISVSEVTEPSRIRVRAEGEDRQVSSRIGMDAVLTLVARPDGGTDVGVDGSYEVVGRVSTMGTGTIRKKAERILDEFFSHAGNELGAG